VTAGNGGTFTTKFPPLSRGTFRAVYDVLLRMTADVANLHQISAVVRRGRHYSTADLTRLKEHVRTTNPAT
jgi:hypothetical protein